MKKLNGIDPEALGLKVGKYAGVQEIHVECPVHGGNGKSASFNFRTGVMHCFSCGANLTAKQISKMLNGEIVIGVFKEKRADDYGKDWEQTLAMPLAINNGYLTKRGVTNSQVEEYEIRLSERGIVFPVKNASGVVEGVVVRQINNHIRYLYGGKRISGWGLEDLKNIHPTEDKLFFVEGIFGALRGRKYGYKVIASLGSMIKEDLIDVSKSYNTVGLFDADDAGYKAGIRLVSGNPLARVIIPGGEADEADQLQWEIWDKESAMTRDRLIIERYTKGYKIKDLEIIRVGAKKKRRRKRNRW